MYQVDANTLSLLHFEDGFKDETGKVWTVSGNAAVSTDQNKFGKSSLYLNAVGDSISIQSPLADLYNSPYTIEAWFYPIVSAGGDGNQWGNIFGFTGLGGDTGAALAVLKAQIASGNPGTLTGLSMYSKDKAAFDTWNHAAITFDGTTTRMFLNGKLQASSSTLNTAVIKNLVVGKTASLYTYQYNGYIDEIRISNIARWTEDFTPTDTQTNPTNPTTSGKLLRITMNDSSEREYRVTDSEVDSFIKWYDRTVNTGNTCYSFNDSVDGSKEYLAFEKIISFKVIALIA